MKSTSPPYHHGDLRQTLLTAAETAIEETGIETLSLRGLARSAGVSHNAPYMHFKDKEALIAALAQEGFARLGAAIRSAGRDSADSWLVSFRKGCHAYVAFAARHPALYAIMHRRYQADRFPDVAQTGVVVFEALMTSFAEGQEKGAVEAGPPRAQALTVWSALHGLSLVLGTRGDLPKVFDGATSDEVTDDLVDTLLAGLARPGEPNP